MALMGHHRGLGSRKVCCPLEQRFDVQRMRVCASNMADGKALEKTIETVQLSCLPSYPGAISWSLDDRVSVITDKCVYVLVSF